MGSTVTVACKLPHGLVLRTFIMNKRYEAILGGGTREVEEAAQVGHMVTIKGYAAPHGHAPNAPVSGGYALTSGVDADFWDEWLRQNAEHPAVKAGLIFATERVDTAKKQAEEQAEIKSGLEPLNPDGDARGRGIRKADLKAA
ncbi:hypothetical protein [Xanthobacter agilis]|uniref:Uncharacterized protein n=1 Tax=Xanthobacter agilis TaxID=47492 RepID=A0ABU0LJY6_XANAG|nr:hypothetical protein [Xanthobacter agilis]MDQ0507404.1 hypothetical protein [Xanthobacter agilis]